MCKGDIYMALIKCPECGKEISDKSKCCIGCGYPLEISEENELHKIVSSIVVKYPNNMTAAIKEYRSITNSTLKDAMDIFEPIYKGEKTLSDIKIKKFDGVYRFSLWSGKEEVYCPRCKSSNCGIFYEHIPEKTKVSYVANLNPFKLFTIANKKEKVIQKARDEERFVCNDCGTVFM